MATFRKRGSNWQAQIIRRGHVPQYKTFPSKAEAQGWARAIEGAGDASPRARSAQPEATDRGVPTLREALDRYAQSVVPTKRWTAKELQRVRFLGRQAIAHLRLTEIRASDLASYRDQRRAAGRAENTVRIELAVLSHLFETARSEWGFDQLLNPVKNIRKPAGSRERDRRLHVDEYRRITQALDEQRNPLMRAMFDLALETTLRQGVLLALQWHWIDLDRRVIRIPAHLRQAKNKGVAPWIPLSIKAVQVIDALPRSDARVFPISQNALLCCWKRIKAKLQIRDLRWHDLRHEAASRLAEGGLNPLELSQITGHRSMQMLRRYTHMSAAHMLARLDAVSVSTSQ